MWLNEILMPFLDPINMWQIELILIITKIVNFSIEQEYFPNSLKLAIITLPIKKSGLDSETLKTINFLKLI